MLAQTYESVNLHSLSPLSSRSQPGSASRSGSGRPAGALVHGGGSAGLTLTNKLATSPTLIVADPAVKGRIAVGYDLPAVGGRRLG
jgi:hypothetical protein